MKWYRHLPLLATALAAGLLGAGCSGVSGSHSISPASFFLPGLVRVHPAPAGSDRPVEPVEPHHLALVR